MDWIVTGKVDGKLEWLARNKEDVFKDSILFIQELIDNLMYLKQKCISEMKLSLYESIDIGTWIKSLCGELNKYVDDVVIHGSGGSPKMDVFIEFMNDLSQKSPEYVLSKSSILIYKTAQAVFKWIIVK